MQQQLSFSKQELRYVKSWSFGGVKLAKRRKTARPLQPKKIIHVVFKSNFSTGPYSLLAHKNLVKSLLKERAYRNFIKIHEWINMGNHLHLKISSNNVDQIKNFLRTFAALLARKITNSHRGKKFGKFWKDLVFTRVLFSSFEELGLRGYFQANRTELKLGYKARQEYIKSYQDFLKKLKKVKAVPQVQSEIFLE